jgi:mannose-1-phosphate guanylyltransferase
MTDRYAVIMAGGSGTRLWPMSRALRPKQLLKLTRDGRSLLQAAVHRLCGLFDYSHIYIIAAADHIEPIAKDLPELPRENLIGEPMGRDTANAVGLAAAVLEARNPDATMGIFTADQLIEPVHTFQRSVDCAFTAIERNPAYVGTFGVRPAWPHTGLGYIHRGNAFAQTTTVPTYEVLAFKEKPDAATALQYVESGEYYWNSGMFIWKLSTVLELLRTNLPENAEKLIDLGRRYGQDGWSDLAAGVYPHLKKISIDFAVMEKAPKVLVVELDCLWTDVGSWPELPKIADLDGDGNAILADRVHAMECRNNVIISSEKQHLIAVIGAEDLVVVHTEDATLVCPKSHAQKIKDLVGQLEKKYERKYT